MITHQKVLSIWALLAMAGLMFVSGCRKAETSNSRDVVCLIGLTNGQHQLVCDLVVRANRTYQLRELENGISNTSTGILSQADFTAARDAVRISTGQGRDSFQPYLRPKRSGEAVSVETLLKLVSHR